MTVIESSFFSLTAAPSSAESRSLRLQSEGAGLAKVVVVLRYVGRREADVSCYVML